MNIKIASVGKEVKAYAVSAIGFVHAGALISSLLAFVCNESATWCSGGSHCAEPVYKSTYAYFSAMTLAAFLSSGVFYVLHCTSMYEKLRCNIKRKFLGELTCMSAIVFFLVFGNVFMISRTGNRVIYMVSTFFGCLAMSIFGVQLVLVFLRNYSLLITEASEAGSVDDQESNSPDCRSDATIQVTAIKCLNIGGHSPGNSPHMKNSSPASSQISQYIPRDDDSDSFSSS